MYNLLIVDDEPLITDSLYDLLTGCMEPEMNVLRAYSGREALSWMENCRIDILLTDISMPDINGLDVHRRMSCLWPECAVIYLTSFDEFEYVQQAIRNNGEDYILKTEGDAAVLSAVNKAAARLDEKQRNKLLLEQARDSLSLALPMLQARFISDLAEAIEAVPDDLPRQLSSLHLPLNADFPVLMVLGQVDGSLEGTATEKIKLIFSARSTMEAYFSDLAAGACAVHEKSKLIMLLQPRFPAEEPPDTEQYAGLAHSLALRISGSLDRLQALCRESCGLSLSFAASGSLLAWGDISPAYDALRMKLRDGAGPGGNGLLYFGQGEQEALQLHAPSVYLETRLQISRLGLLKNCLENGDREGFMDLYDSVMATACIHGASPYDIRAEIYYRIAAMFIEYINKWAGRTADEHRPDIGRLINMEGHASWEDAVGYFRALAESLFQKQHSEMKKNENRIFAFIREYTNNNIGGDLSLTRFALLLSFHPFYLSRLFKQITGETLSDYVSKVKLEKARGMLGGIGRISDVSSALGFMTPSYFTSFFRKHTGMSPLEYRNLMLKENS